MTTKFIEWAYGHRQPTKIQLSGRLSREFCSLDDGTGGMISMNLEVIWEMSDQIHNAAKTRRGL